MDPALPLTAERDPRPVVSEDRIREVVTTFYQRVRRDELIGPIFERRVADWPSHLDLLCDFWSSALNRSGRYRGRPMPRHLGLGLEQPHFRRWLSLFSATCGELCTPGEAALFAERSQRMAAGMMVMLGLTPRESE